MCRHIYIYVGVVLIIGRHRDRLTKKICGTGTRRKLIGHAPVSTGCTTNDSLPRVPAAMSSLPRTSFKSCPKQNGQCFWLGNGEQRPTVLVSHRWVWANGFGEPPGVGWPTVLVSLRRTATFQQPGPLQKKSPRVCKCQGAHC